MLQVGASIPAINVKDQNGAEHKLSDMCGEKAIIFFYPKDNTPGCTAESCNLRDNYADLKKLGYTVLGVSADTEKKHQNFIEKYNLPYPLIADTEKEMINAFGVWGPKKFMGKEYDGIHRTTFIVENGAIEHVIQKVKTKDHTNQILEIIA